MLTSRSFRLCVLGLDPIVNLANIDIDAPVLGTLTPTLARSPLFMQMAAVARVARTWQEAEKLDAWRSDGGPVGAQWDVSLGQLVWFHRMGGDRRPGSKGPKRLHLLPGPYWVIQEVASGTFKLQDVYSRGTVTAKVSMLSPLHVDNSARDGVNTVAREVTVDAGFVPAEICGQRTNADGEVEWQVCWEDFSEAENTWEPAHVLRLSEAGCRLMSAAVQLSAVEAAADVVGVVDVSPAGAIDRPVQPAAQEESSRDSFVVRGEVALSNKL